MPRNDERVKIPLPGYVMSINEQCKQLQYLEECGLVSSVKNKLKKKNDMIDNKFLSFCFRLTMTIAQNYIVCRIAITAVN